MSLGPQFDKALQEWVNPSMRMKNWNAGALNSAISSHSSEAPTLYRGIRMPSGVTREEFRKSVTDPGGYTVKPSDDSIRDGSSGFSSWSEDSSVADQFAAEQSDVPGDQVIFKVSGLKGLPVHKHMDPEEFDSDFIEEKEWLVPGDSSIRFKHTIRPNKDTQIFVGQAVPPK